MNDDDVLPILPTFPEVRCDKCRHADAQDEAAQERRLEGRLSDSDGFEPW